MPETKPISSGGGVYFDLILNHIKDNVTKDVRYNCAECGRLKNNGGELSGTLCPSCESSNLSLDPVLNKFTTLVKNLQFDIENSLRHNKNPNTVFLKPSSNYNSGVLSAKENNTLPAGRKWKDKPPVVNIGRMNNLAIQTDLSFSPFDDVSFVVKQNKRVSIESTKPVSEGELEKTAANTHVNFSQKAENKYTFKPIGPEENIAESEISHPSAQNQSQTQSEDNENLDNIDIIITKSQEQFIETETEMIESSVNDNIMLLARKTNNASPLLFSPETKDTDMNCSDDDTECVGGTPPRENENVCTWRKPGSKPSETQQDIEDQEMLDVNEHEMNTKDGVTNNVRDSNKGTNSEEQSERLNHKFDRTKIEDSEETKMESKNEKQKLINKNSVRNIGKTEENMIWNSQDQKQNKEINEKHESTNMEENCDDEPMQTYDNKIEQNQNDASVNKLGVETKDSNRTCISLRDGTIGDNLDNKCKNDSISNLNNDNDTTRNPITQMKIKDDQMKDNEHEFKDDPVSNDLTEDELLTQNSQKFSKHNLKIVISNVEGSDLDHLEKFIAMFNPLLDNDVSQSSNFLVVGVDGENRVLRRTPKFLKAICLHVCIVNIDYLVQCCQVGDIVHLEKKFIPYDSSGLNGPIRSCISPNSSLLGNFVFFSLETDEYLSSLLEFIIIQNGGILVPDIKLFKVFNRDIVGTPEPQRIKKQELMGPPAVPGRQNTSSGVQYKKILLYGDNEEPTFSEAYKMKLFVAYKCYSLNYKRLFDCVASYDVVELGV